LPSIQRESKKEEASFLLSTWLGNVSNLARFAMRMTVLLLGLISLFLTSKVEAQADSAAEAVAIIDKAIRAMGGTKNLAKYQAAAFKTKGRFVALDQNIEFTGEAAIQAPKRFRETIEGEVGGKKFIMMRAIDGDKGWLTQGDKVLDMDAETLKQEKEQLFVAWVTTLLPLKDSAFDLSLIGASKIGAQEVVGVKVYHRGHYGINLYFDKETGLLAKSTMRAKDPQIGKEVDVDTFYSDYKEVLGIKQATKLTMKRAGKTFFELELSTVQRHQKLDDKDFAKP
jgi:hypothetical protein